ncbi:MAG: putative dehydrogenase [Paraglaciecola sp.]
MKKALIIGSGSIGRRHAENIRQLFPGIEFMLLRRTALQNTLAKDLGARAVLCMEDALKWTPDFAVISSPSSKHLEDLIPLLKNKIPFYIEKPVVTTKNDLEYLQKSLIDGAPVTMSGCNLRFLPSVSALKKIICEGEIGVVVRATLEAGQWLPDWRPLHDYRKSYSADSLFGGGVLFDLVHELDMARFLFGEFSDVRAFAAKNSSLEITSEDTACVILKAKEGNILVSVNLDYVSRVPKRRYEIVGEKGSLCWDLWENTLLLIKPEGNRRIDCGVGAFDVAATYLSAMTEFTEGVKSNADTSQNLQEGMYSAELVIKVREMAGL